MEALEVDSQCFARQASCASLQADTFVRLPFDLDKMDSEGHQGSVGFIFTIANTMMGSTVLALGWGFGNAGILASAFFTCFFGFIGFYSATIILDTAASQSEPVGDFSELCETYLGAVGRSVANITSVFILFGATTCYHVLIATNLQSAVLSLVKHWYPASGDLFFCCGAGNFQYLVAAFMVAVVVLPLMFVRDISKLAAVGSYGVFGLLYNCLFIVGSGVLNLSRLAEHPSDKLGHVKLVGGPQEVGVFVGLMGLSLFMHSVLLPIANNHVHAKTAPAIVKRDIGIAYVFAVVFYICVGAVPAVAFQLGRDVLPQYTDLNLTELPQNMLEASGVFHIGAIIGAFLTGLQLSVVYPILGSVCRMQFFAQFYPSANDENGVLGIEAMSIFNVVLVGITALITAVYPHPGQVVGYVGAYTAVVYLIWLPVLVKLSALRRAGQMRWWSFAGNVILAITATGVVLLQFIFSKEVEQNGADAANGTVTQIF